MGLIMRLGIQKNVMGLSLGYWLGTFFGLQLSINGGIKLGFSDQKEVGTTPGAVAGVPIRTYIGSEPGYLEGSTDGYMDGKFDGFLDQWTEFSLEQIMVLN